MSAEPVELVFALAAAVHLGFQVTVTLLVYPALADAAARSDGADWQRTHDRHSRRIVPLVGVVYGALLVSGVSLVLRQPSAWALVGVVGAAVAVGTTAVAAAPLHGRLARVDGRADASAVRRLLRVDRVRCAGAVVAAAGAAAACV